MANTFFAIAKNNLTSSQSSVVFSGIPQTYTDLYIVISVRNTGGTTGTNYIRMQANSATNEFSGRYIEGYGNSLVGAGYTQNDPYMTQLYGNVLNGATADVFGSVEIYIPNYAGSITKPMSGTGISENNNATASWGIDAVASFYNSGSAITSLTFTPTSNSFASNSSFHLYGIKNS